MLLAVEPTASLARALPSEIAAAMQAGVDLPLLIVELVASRHSEHVLVLALALLLLLALFAHPLPFVHPLLSSVLLPGPLLPRQLRLLRRLPPMLPAVEPKASLARALPSETAAAPPGGVDLLLLIAEQVARRTSVPALKQVCCVPSVTYRRNVYTVLAFYLFS